MSESDAARIGAELGRSVYDVLAGIAAWRQALADDQLEARFGSLLRAAAASKQPPKAAAKKPPPKPAPAAPPVDTSDIPF